MIQSNCAGSFKELGNLGNQTDYTRLSFRIKLDDIFWLQTETHDKTVSKNGLI